MINFIDINKEEPHILFKKKYNDAINANQENIEAVSKSSFNKEKSQVDSRYVNLKIVKGNNFIFFSNYNSKKAEQFSSNNNIAALFFWNKINTQIRIKAKIHKLDNIESDTYFRKRQKEKNALAISSMQSTQIESFDKVKQNFFHVLKNEDLKKRPVYWGGYRFVPFEFEFWEGHMHRLNQRTHYELKNGIWKKELLQP